MCRSCKGKNWLERTMESRILTRQRTGREVTRNSGSGKLLEKMELGTANWEVGRMAALHFLFNNQSSFHSFLIFLTEQRVESESQTIS